MKELKVKTTWRELLPGDVVVSRFHTLFILRAGVAGLVGNVPIFLYKGHGDDGRLFINRSPSLAPNDVVNDGACDVGRVFRP